MWRDKDNMNDNVNFRQENKNDALSVFAGTSANMEEWKSFPFPTNVVFSFSISTDAPQEFSTTASPKFSSKVLCRYLSSEFPSRSLSILAAVQIARSNRNPHFAELSEPWL